MLTLPDSWKALPKKANTVAYELRLCGLLGLTHPDAEGDGPALNLGAFEPTASLILVEKITTEWLREKRTLIAEQVAAGEWDDLSDDDLPVKPWLGQLLGMDDGRKRAEALLTFGYLFLTYPQYLENITKGVRPATVRKMRSHGRVDHGQVQSSETPIYRPLDMRFLIARGGVLQDNPDGWTPDVQGYLAYLGKVAPGMAAFLSRQVPALLPAAAMLRHTYVTGAIGSGKTELLKLLVHGLVSAGNCAVVVLDPHGDMAEQVAHWPEFGPGGWAEGRLVYVDPFLDADHTPCLNPFDLGGRRPTPADAQQFIEALEEVLGNGDGASITVPMRNILHHTVPVLIGQPGRSPVDLVRFMNSTENVDLVEEARRVLPPDEAAFFAGEFQATQYQQTRLAITTKLRVMLRAGRALFVGSSTINLEQLIDQQKVIVFNLARGRLGVEASAALGRFILAGILALAHRRAGTQRGKRVPAHVLVDECHNYLGPSVEQILTDARKFGVCLTLCQQQVGQGMSGDLARSVIGNPELKITGTNEIASLRTVAASTNTPLDEFQKLKDRQFLIARRGKLPFTLDAAAHLADERRAMSEADWQTVKAAQLTAYYRTHMDGPDKPTPDAPKPKYDL